MYWIVKMFCTSIGKKLLMAVTGLGFIIFLFFHMVGNMTLYVGKDMFESYAAHLHALAPIVAVVEWGLIFFAVIHISIGMLLFFENLQSRPVRYAVKHRAGGRTIGSATMGYTGPLILTFVIVHLLNFRFIDMDQQSLFSVVSGVLSRPYYMAFYTIAVILVAIHVRHGFWSLFQTLGANHPKYMPIIQGIGIFFAVLVAAGFGIIPVYIGLLA